MAKANRLPASKKAESKAVTFGVCATSDPRIDAPSRERCVNIIEMVADAVAGAVSEAVRAWGGGTITGHVV